MPKEKKNEFPPKLKERERVGPAGIEEERIERQYYVLGLRSAYKRPDGWGEV